MKLAVIGAGIFGCTIAWKLASEGLDVDLYEKNRDILSEASGINQYRLHRGYHYPRSPETALQCLSGELSFRKTYKDAIIDEFAHYYCISRKGTLTSASQFREFCKKIGLTLQEVVLEVVSPEKIESSFRVNESLFDPVKLKDICQKKLDEHRVNILHKEASKSVFKIYDRTIVATYSRINELLAPTAKREYLFEICEKPIARLPSSLKDKSLVILDGPFMCLDPYGRTGNFVLGNVVQAIYHSNCGFLPQIPPDLAPYLNQGIIADLPSTRFGQFIKSGEEFIPEISQAKHIGSMFTVRTVPAHREHDDARPTEIVSISKRHIAIYSGKIPTCVDAANNILRIIKNEREIVEREF